MTGVEVANSNVAKNDTVKKAHVQRKRNKKKSKKQRQEEQAKIKTVSLYNKNKRSSKINL
jgi:hypothetical protein